MNVLVCHFVDTNAEYSLGNQRVCSSTQKLTKIGRLAPLLLNHVTITSKYTTPAQLPCPPSVRMNWLFFGWVKSAHTRALILYIKKKGKYTSGPLVTPTALIPRLQPDEGLDRNMQRKLAKETICELSVGTKSESAAHA